MFLKFLYNGENEIIEIERAKELGLIAPEISGEELRSRLEAEGWIGKPDDIILDKDISFVSLPTQNSRGNWV